MSKKSKRIKRVSSSNGGDSFQYDVGSYIGLDTERTIGSITLDNNIITISDTDNKVIKKLNSTPNMEVEYE